MPATITGIVFNDLNHNGVFDTGEPGIPNVFVYLVGPPGIVEAQTDANGNYSFSVTVAGTYTVYETVAQNTTNPPTVFTQPSGFTVSNGPRKINVTVTAANITGNAVLSGNNFAHDTNSNPLTCTADFIQYVDIPTEWITINLVTGNDVDRGELTPPHYINAIGYNTLDNYIYGYDDTVNSVSRVDASGNVMVLGEPTGLPVTTNQYNTGCFDDNGFLYLYYSQSARFYVVDLRPNSSTFMKLVNPLNNYAEQTAAFGIALVNGTPNISDWVWLPADATTGTGVNGFLYGVQIGGVMARVNLDNAHVINMTTNGPMFASSFGAMGVDVQGNIYAVSNLNGSVYRYIINDITATGSFFSTTLFDSHNDGAMCRMARLLIDYGDAPDTGIGNGAGNYNTLLANNGPRHEIVTGLTLGTQITAEEDAYQNFDATGDDLTLGIQDDGVARPLPPLSISATTYELEVVATNDTPNNANLYAWVDFNQNGLFEVNESSMVVVPANSGTSSYTMNFTVPPGTIINSGVTFTRLRLTTDTLAQGTDAIGQDTASVGPAGDGEVEDYILDVSAMADLAITKVADADSVIIGDTLTYTITITNNGPDAAQTPLLVDSIPPELINPVYSIDGGLTFQDISLGSLVLPTLQPGDVFTVIVKGVVNQFADGIIDNTATISSTTPDPDMSNNTATTATPIINAADVSIVKTGSQASVTAGDLLTYTLTISNAGPSPSENTIVTDAISAAILNPQYSLNGSTPLQPWPGELNIGELAPSATATITIQGTVASFAEDPITNTATVTSDTPDPNPDNNTSTLDTTVVGSADLAITKQADQTQVHPGDPLTYTIQVVNNGPSDAENVLITDSIPIPLINAEFSTDNGVTFQPWPGSFTLASLPNGATFTILIRGIVDPNTTIGLMANTATVASDTPDPDLNNNTVIALTIINQPVAEQADLSVRKVANPPIAIIGEMLEYTVTVTNNGPDDAINAILTDNLPPQLLNPELSFDGINFDPFTSPIPLGDIADGATVNVFIQGTVDPTIDPNLLSTITNVATVTSDTPDPNLANNTFTRLTPLEASADLAIEKTLLTDPLIPGNPILYQLTITNNGPSSAQGAVVSDLIPTAITNPQYSLDGGITFQTWTGSLPLGTIDPQQEVVILIQGSLSAATTSAVTNTAHIRSSTPDPNLSNNTSTITNDVTPTATLTVTKTASPNPVNVGDVLTFSIFIRNNGPSSTQNVVVTDDIPSGLTNVVFSTDGINFQPWTGSFTYPVIPAGGARTLLIRGTVTAAAGDTITNTVHARGNDTPDESASVDVSVVASADVAITKTANVNNVVAGDSLVFTLTVNNFGPSSAENVIVTDAIPDTLTNVQYSLDQVNWLPWTGQFEIGTLAPNQVVTIFIRGTVTTAAMTRIINTAVVRSTTSDPNLANNSSSYQVHVSQSADLSITKTPDKTEVSVGDVVTYTLNIANAGPSDAGSVMVQDDVPAGLDNVEFSLDGVNFMPWISPFSVGTLPAGTAQVIFIRGTVNESATSFIANTAIISSGTPDPDPTNNASTSVITVTQVCPPSSSADLAITKLPSVETIVVGDVVFYSLFVVNNGPDIAENVVVTDMVQGILENPQYSLDGGVTWQDWTGSLALGNLEPGATADILISGTVLNAAAASNTAMVLSNTADPDITNNVSTIETEVAAVADLMVAKIACDPVVFPCKPILYTVVITNNGPSTADDVILRDPLPEEVHCGEFSLDNGKTWRDWNGFVNLGSISAGATITILIQAIVNCDARGVICNRASVVSSTFDPDLDNNSALAETKVC